MVFDLTHLLRREVVSVQQALLLVALSLEPINLFCQLYSSFV
jgi:hypothetical protein